MSAPVISVDPIVIQHFKDLKTAKSYRYLICDIDAEGKRISLVRAGPRSDTYGDLVAKYLPASKSVYVLFDYEFVKDNKPLEGVRDVMFYLVWIPQEASIADKTLAAASAQILREVISEHVFVGGSFIAFEHQATTLEEAKEEVIKKKVDAHVH